MSSISSLVDEVFVALQKKDLTLVTAESCTGGMIAAAITDKSGSSAILERGFVTYSNTAKEEDLDVPQWLIDRHGAVSEQVVLSMANGALTNSHADISIAVTGVAGPTGGSDEKPVGLVYIACQLRGGETKVTKNNFTGDRDNVRRQTVVKALELILEVVN